MYSSEPCTLGASPHGAPPPPILPTGRFVPPTAADPGGAAGVPTGVQYGSQHRRRVQCNNCGMQGHYFRECDKPVTSYGIVCLNQESTHVLLVRRKHTLSFMEFLRGHYSLEHLDMLLYLLYTMTAAEREQIRRCRVDDFKQMWTSVFPMGQYRFPRPDFSHGQQRFAEAVSSRYHCPMDLDLDSMRQQIRADLTPTQSVHTAVQQSGQVCIRYTEPPLRLRRTYTTSSSSSAGAGGITPAHDSGSEPASSSATEAAAALVDTAIWHRTQPPPGFSAADQIRAERPPAIPPRLCVRPPFKWTPKVKSWCQTDLSESMTNGSSTSTTTTTTTDCGGGVDADGVSSLSGRPWLSWYRFLDHIPVLFDEQEWGFPKGRRHMNESEWVCAQREWSEETNLPSPPLAMWCHNSVINEEYWGSNNVEYRTRYFVCHYEEPTALTTPRLGYVPDHESSEISARMWVPLSNAMAYFRSYQVTKLTVIGLLQEFLKEQVQWPLSTTICVPAEPEAPPVVFEVLDEEQRPLPKAPTLLAPPPTKVDEDEHEADNDPRPFIYVGRPRSAPLVVGARKKKESAFGRRPSSPPLRTVSVPRAFSVPHLDARHLDNVHRLASSV